MAANVPTGLVDEQHNASNLAVGVRSCERRDTSFSEVEQRCGYSLAGMLDLFESWALGRGLQQIIGQGDDMHAHPEPAIDEAPLILDHAQLLKAIPWLSKPALRQAANLASLIARRGRPDTGWIVRSPASLGIVSELIDAGVVANEAIEMFAFLRSTTDQLAARIAAVVATIEPDTRRAAFLRRNRAQLGRATATLIVDAVGHRLPNSDRGQVRIGAVQNQRTPSKRRGES